MTSRDEFRSAMSLFATGVTVVTSMDEEGKPHSMTANSFTSVCLDPPIVLICVAHGTHTYGYVEHNGRFGINILGENQENLGVYFAKRPEDRVEGTEYHYTIAEDDIPMLDHSMVFFGCQVVGSHVYGDHTVYMGEVKEVRRTDAGTPLMFYQSRWYHPADRQE